MWLEACLASISKQARGHGEAWLGTQDLDTLALKLCPSYHALVPTLRLRYLPFSPGPRPFQTLCCCTFVFFLQCF